ncbi:LysR family transcriptional regulator [Pseudoroseicyclus sp. H15]
MERYSLDDLRLFVAVADAGGLAGASRATGTSLATLSRRMTALERALARRLFVRGKRGYALTAEGRALLAEAAALRDAAQRLDRWAAAESPAPRVRITAGSWTARFLARGLAGRWSAGAGWVPELLASNARVDIARREADIGIRNRRPDQSWLAGKVTRRVDYAVYATGPDVPGFLALPEDAATTPSDRWVKANHGGEILTSVSDIRLGLDLALAGMGRIVLPCFVGDGEPGLQRQSDEIAEIGHDEWLVTHHEARHDPPVRRAIEMVEAILV